MDKYNKKIKMLKKDRHQMLDELESKERKWSYLKKLDNYKLLKLWNEVYNTDYTSFDDFEPADRTGPF